MPKISLVIPTVDRPDAVRNLLRRLESQVRPPDEVLVVDQSRREETRESACAAVDPRIRYVRIARRGLPGARNEGVRLSSGDVVLFIDDDVIPDPALVGVHLENYDDPTVAGVGGRVIGGYDAATDRVGEFRAVDGKVVRNFGASARREVDHLPGGNMSFRREVFERIGGFDKAYGGPAIGEETDFCLRARRAGFRLVFDPRAVVEHVRMEAGGCRTARFEEWLYWHAHNTMLFTLRWARFFSWPFFFLKRILRFAMFAVEHGSIPLVAVGLVGLVKGVATYIRGRG